MLRSAIRTLSEASEELAPDRDGLATHVSPSGIGIAMNAPQVEPGRGILAWRGLAAHGSMTM